MTNATQTHADLAEALLRDPRFAPDPAGAAVIRQEWGLKHKVVALYSGNIARKQGIIHSMTPKERSKPDLIKATRKRRIAAGAGVQVHDVNRLLKEFEQMQDMMKKMQGGGLMKMMKRMGGMKGFGGMGGGFPGMPR